MKYFKSLFLSLKEIFIVMVIQYIILIGTILIFGINDSIIIGTILIMLFEIIYIISKVRKVNIKKRRINYFPYILLGISISSIYNMIIFKLDLGFSNTVNIPIFINIISSGIIGPIFEEFLFRYSFINKLEKFNSKSSSIIISSIIFGILHGNLITIIYATIIGGINSYLYIKSRNILIPISIHIAGNIFVELLFGYNSLVLLLGFILFIISLLILKKNNKYYIK